MKALTITYQRRVPLADRFWAKVDRSGGADACWPWRAALNNKGYGMLSDRRHVVLAHRTAYELARGAIAPGLVICHACDNPPCCNPAHLWAGTTTANMQDALHKGRMAVGERNGICRLTAEKVRAIRVIWARGGVKQLHLAKQFGVSQGAIRGVVLGITWKHVT